MFADGVATLVGTSAIAGASVGGVDVEGEDVGILSGREDVEVISGVLAGDASDVREVVELETRGTLPAHGLKANCSGW